MPLLHCCKRPGHTALYLLHPIDSGCMRAGVGLGCVAVAATGVSDAMMLAAARGLAHKVTRAELAADSVLPRIERIRSA